MVSFRLPEPRNEEPSCQIPPPPPRLTLLATALLAALSAAPTLAQTLPVVELLVSDTEISEMYDCASPGAFQINAGVQADGSPLPGGRLTFQVAAITASGPNRFADPHGHTPREGQARSSKFLNKADGTGLIAAKNASIKGFAEMTLTSKGLSPTGLCWGDDNLDTGDTEVMVVIANGPGYTVHPTKGRAIFTIRENDSCANPTAATGGVVHRMNGSSTCICATKSRSSEVRRALDRTIPTPGPDGRFGTDDDGTTDAPEPSAGFLSRLAAQFHDPSYLYCMDSPYKGLP